MAYPAPVSQNRCRIPVPQMITQRPQRTDKDEPARPGQHDTVGEFEILVTGRCGQQPPDDECRSGNEPDSRYPVEDRCDRIDLGPVNGQVWRQWPSIPVRSFHSGPLRVRNLRSGTLPKIAKYVPSETEKTRSIFRSPYGNCHWRGRSYHPCGTPARPEPIGIPTLIDAARGPRCRIRTLS